MYIQSYCLGFRVEGLELRVEPPAPFERMGGLGFRIQASAGDSSVRIRISCHHSSSCHHSESYYHPESCLHDVRLTS